MIQLPAHPRIAGARYFGASKLIIHPIQNVAEHHELASVFAAIEPELLSAGSAVHSWGVRATISGQSKPGYIAAAGSAYRAFEFNSVGLRVNMAKIPQHNYNGSGPIGGVVYKQAKKFVGPAGNTHRLSTLSHGSIPSAKYPAEWTGAILTTADSMAGGMGCTLRNGDMNSVCAYWQEDNGTLYDKTSDPFYQVAAFDALGALVFVRLCPAAMDTSSFIDRWVANHELAGKSGGPEKLAAVADVLRRTFPLKMTTSICAAVFPDGGAYLVTGVQPTAHSQFHAASSSPSSDPYALQKSNFGDPVMVGDHWYPGNRLNLAPGGATSSSVLMSSTARAATVSITGSASALLGAPITTVVQATEQYSPRLDVGMPLPRTLFGVPIDGIFGPAFAELGTGDISESEYFGACYDKFCLSSGSEPTTRNANGLVMTDAEFVAANGTKRDDWAHQGYTSGQAGFTPVFAAFIANWALSHSRDGVVADRDVLNQMVSRMSDQLVSQLF